MLGGGADLVDVEAVRRRGLDLVDDLVALSADRLLDVLDLGLRLGLDVRLLGEGRDGVAQLLARLLYVLADRARVFAHSTSSFTLSVASSGTGGVACCTRLRPCSASTPAPANRTEATISAASQ